ncbi:chemotaxis protein CheW [Cohnella soli]|uniref:Chemotaxis protein CheW n=1 Tax=Cohnella soli TaxID=425005 RepID=A0ABW0HTI3_9BACL
MSDYIVIGLNGEPYALPLADIQEIIKRQPVTEVPCDKPYVKGIMNLRGRIVPVIGLGDRIGMPEAEASPASRIVVVSAEDGDIGVCVDVVEQVASLEEVLPPTTEQTGGVSRGYLSGIGKLNGRLIGVLDLKAVLGQKEVR